MLLLVPWVTKHKLHPRAKDFNFPVSPCCDVSNHFSVQALSKRAQLSLFTVYETTLVVVVPIPLGFPNLSFSFVQQRSLPVLPALRLQAAELASHFPRGNLQQLWHFKGAISLDL